MKTKFLVSASVLTLVSSIVLAGNLHFSIGVPVVGAVYYNSNIIVRGAYVPANHHRGYYVDNNARPIDPYRGLPVYAAPVVIYNQSAPVVVYHQTDPLNELRAFCAPNVAKVCSGSTCVLCN
jgi:hypothetical protein